MLGARQLTCSVLKFPSWLWFCEQRTRCRIATSGMVGFWCAFFNWVYLRNTSLELNRWYESGACLLCMCCIYSLFVLLLGMYLLLYLRNKSSIIEHQFTSVGYWTLCNVHEISSGPCIFSCQRESKYKNSGAGCSMYIHSSEWKMLLCNSELG